MTIYHLTFKCDLDLHSTWPNFSNGTATPHEEQLCQIILKSMHKCTSYGPDSSIYNHFIIWPSSVTLIFNLPEQMFQMAFLLLKENNCAKLFWNPCINVEVTAWTNPDGCMHTQSMHTPTMNAHTLNWNCNLLTTSGLNKKVREN